MQSVHATDSASKAVQKTPNRVSLDYIMARIADIEFINPKSTPHMTIAILTMVNGFVVVGKSAPADPENYDADLGCQFAKEDAIRQLWQLEGYALRERLSAPQAQNAYQFVNKYQAGLPVWSR